MGAGRHECHCRDDTAVLRRRRLPECPSACGKPLKDARVEVARAIDGVRAAVRAIHAQHGREIPMGLDQASAGRFAVTYQEPRGVVVAISAFNHPLNLVVHQVAPAAAGGPVIIKPSLSTPLACRRFVDLLIEAGLPPDACQMVVCDNDLAQRLVSDARNSFLTFIGSAKVGWKLRSALPPGARCALEHGGLAPMVVDETAELEAIGAPLVRGS
jgi:acyl-CoA reductase-like NAD-dependent aldehyde dehydrogenase